MEIIIETIKKSLETENYYSGMYVILAFIGTCSRKQYPSKKDNEAYKKWLEEYYTPLCKNKYSGNFIPPDTIYQLRCSILHESTTDLKLKGNNTISHIIVTTGSHFNFSTTNGYKEIEVNAKLFILELLDAINIWLVCAKKTGIDTQCNFDIINGRWSSKDINDSCAFKDCL